MPGLRTLGAVLNAIRLVFEAFVLSLRHNMGMGVLALGLSTSIWVFITNEQNPPRTAIVPFHISVQPVNVPSNLDVLPTIEPVLVRVTAPSDLWNGLTESSFEGTVDLTAAQQGAVRKAVTVKPRDARVRVLEVIPSQVEVQLDELLRRTVPVQVNIRQDPPLGFGHEQPRPEVQQVAVLGPQQLVVTVDAAVADLNLSGFRSDVRQSFPLEARSARGYDVSGVRLEPQSVVIAVRITQQSAYSTLPVLPDIAGIPAPGFWVSQVRVTPPTVAVVGPPDVVQQIATIRTGPVDVNNLAGSVTRSVLVAPPAGVTVLDRSAVQVEVTVQPIRGNAVALVAPQIRGLGSGLNARSDAASVEVTVTGEGPPLRDFNSGRVQVFLHLEGRSTGTYEVEAQVELPAGLQLVRVVPARVRVTVEPEG